MIPNFISYRSGSGSISIHNPSVKVASSEIIGDYEVSVLEVRDSSALNNWLENNGFSKFPVDATKTIDDYVSDNWLFVVAKLKTITDGLATPHPIMLEFETVKPVYPMKLTAIPGSSVYLELFVVGEDEAVLTNYSMEKEYCNFFDYKEISDHRFSPSDDQMGFVHREFFEPNMDIAHPDALKVMWDGCVVTKFAGEVASNEIMEDMFFGFKEANPSRAELYSSVGKLNKAYNTLILAVIIGSIVLTAFYRIGIIFEIEIKVPAIKLLVILLVVGATGFGISYETVGENIDLYTVHRSWYQNIASNLLDLFSIPHNDPSNGPELIDLLQKNGIDNPITGEPIKLEHSPGNMIVEKVGDSMVFKVCLENGSLYNLF